MDDETKKDSGYKSRKLVLTLIAMLLILIGGIIAVKSVAFAGIFPTYVGGILGAAGLYLTGNVANDFLTKKVESHANTTIQVASINKAGPLVVSETDKHQDGE